MGWAVVQTVEPYHPEGNPNTPLTTEFTHWIFDTREEASQHKAGLMIHYKCDRLIAVTEVPEESWTKLISTSKTDVVVKKTKKEKTDDE